MRATSGGAAAAAANDWQKFDVLLHWTGGTCQRRRTQQRRTHTIFVTIYDFNFQGHYIYRFIYLENIYFFQV